MKKEKKAARRRTPKATRGDFRTASEATGGAKRFTAEVKLFTETEQYRRDLRDIYAGLALMGGFNEYLTSSAWDDYEDFAESCFNMADAMLRERELRDKK